MHADTRVHALAPQCKVLGALLFVIAVAATPHRAVWAFAAHLCLVAAAGAAARVRARFVLRRLTFELPLVACALLLPLTAGDDGLWAAWSVIAKATLGAVATILLAATTPVSDLLRGLEALRVPPVFTSVAAFMFRYADVVTGEARRMRVARQSRGYDPRWLWQGRALAAATGSLFVRSFERGERVYVAMLARGFDGTLPRGATAAPPGDWMLALALPAAAGAVAVGAA